MTIKTEAYQIGLSGTASQNFHLTAAAADGTMQLYRGNPGAPIGAALLSIDAAGVVSYPGDAAWTVTTPTPVPSSGAFGAATAQLKWRKIGRTVFYHAHVFITNMGTVPSTASVALALPFPAAANSPLYEYNAIGRESQTVGNPLLGFILQGGTTVTIATFSGGSLLVNNILNLSGFYESAT